MFNSKRISMIYNSKRKSDELIALKIWKCLQDSVEFKLVFNHFPSSYCLRGGIFLKHAKNVI